MRTRLRGQRKPHNPLATTPPPGRRPAWLQKLENRAGFSIVELLLSVIIISVGVVGFASAVGLASLELWFGRRDTDISMVVTDQLERLKAAGHDAVTSGSREQGEIQLTWQSVGSNPKKVVLVATYPTNDGPSGADTVITYLWP